ncbi:TetR family transcriptional regulator [Acidaminococcus timonensis]|uniref:TetR family transcriptional regulator n=1 Tax=Acidaminococcus timonensis TaxID=1871002 RepID=UPI0025992F35|nr:TetR family transcriptional regulator [uncultured Acidaminococcus sp.]
MKKTLMEEIGQKRTLSIRQKRNMAYFVEATEKILQKEGLGGVTIRRVAAEAGYNSATLYNYFQDLDDLILFGSVCYLREYLVDLAHELQPGMDSLERYRTIYRCFNNHAFQAPEIFYNMFFGKYSHRLEDVIQTYYLELFPEELKELPEDARQMVLRGNLAERDQVVMQHMVEDGFVEGSRAAETLEIIVALHESYIHKAYLANCKESIETLRKGFRHIFEYVLAQARPAQP